ncbi:hypothetical protein LR002_01200 [Candidatus Gracilibacteria bacterium]|nr:hypothetical protein [Candidatus Gracilibacteria bacterium]
MKIFLLSCGLFFLMQGVGFANTGISNNASKFDLNTLFVNKAVVNGTDVGEVKAKNVDEMAALIVKMITGLIGGFAVLGVVLGGFMILTSGGSDNGMNKGKKIIIYSLVGIAMSLVSYALIQLVQIFLFSF